MFTVENWNFDDLVVLLGANFRPLPWGRRAPAVSVRCPIKLRILTNLLFCDDSIVLHCENFRLKVQSVFFTVGEETQQVVLRQSESMTIFFFFEQIVKPVLFVVRYVTEMYIDVKLEYADK